MSKLTYIKQIDGFRGVVALIIVLYHWPMEYFSVSVGGEFLQWFYVLSGYLISRILLYDKSKNPGLKDFITNFLYRRSFRIFPLYFAFLFLGLMVYFLGVFMPFFKPFAEEMSRNWAYLVTYTYNYMGVGNFMMDKSYTSSLMFGHMWSLSLEEQFYIFYPFLVYFLSLRNLKIAIVAAIILGPVMRGVSFALLQEWNPDDVVFSAVNAFRMTHCQIDSFAIGSLLAITGFKRIKNHKLALGIIVLLYVAINVFNRWLVIQQGSSYEEIGGHRRQEVWTFHNYQHLYFFTVINFMGAFFFMAFERGYDLFGLFSTKLAAYLGKISYGIYVYHVPILAFWLIGYHKLMPFVPGANASFVHKIGFEFIAFAGYWILLIGISHISYTYFEMYFLKLKEKIDAKKAAKAKQNSPTKPVN